MKSVIHQATSVPKAVEKAWQSAGQPKEFTVTVYETEERNVFGFVRRNAVVSVVYDDKAQEKQQRRARQPRGGQKSPERVRSKSQGSVGVSNKRGRRSSEQRSSHVPSVQAKVPQAQQSNQTKSQGRDEYGVWGSDAMDDIRTFLDELAAIMNVSTKFDVHVDRRLLKVTFVKPVIDTPSEERMLFASLAYLLMQFLKRKHKKQFKGCHLAITSQR